MIVYVTNNKEPEPEPNMLHVRYKEMVSNIITLRYDIYISKINSMGS